VAAGLLEAASKVNLADSGVALAVRAGAPRPDISSEQAVRAAVLAARSIGYSTGPSGVALARLFERWGISQQLAGRVVQAPPGVPVGSLVAGGEVELGFQQLSELIHLDGIALLGSLPEAIRITTTFSAAISQACAHKPAAQALLKFLVSDAVVAVKLRQGMEPVAV
jgi:molybdate transport system substrate-binding protein